jgi:putative spermidine/putrescine transport system substrate-binding protein
MKQLFLATLLGSTIAMCSAAMAADTDLKTLEAAAKAEGAVNSVGMPDDWANWKGTWEDLAKKYGLKHIDTDMSSAQEIAKFAAEKDNATADIGDVGAAFGPIAVKQGVVQPYKHLGSSPGLGQGQGRQLGTGLHRHHRLHRQQEAAARLRRTDQMG